MHFWFLRTFLNIFSLQPILTCNHKNCEIRPWDLNFCKLEFIYYNDSYHFFLTFSSLQSLLFSAPPGLDPIWRLKHAQTQQGPICIDPCCICPCLNMHIAMVMYAIYNSISITGSLGAVVVVIVCNQCLLPLKLRGRIPFMARITRYIM